MRVFCDLASGYLGICYFYLDRENSSEHLRIGYAYLADGQACIHLTEDVSARELRAIADELHNISPSLPVERKPEPEGPTPVNLPR